MGRCQKRRDLSGSRPVRAGRANASACSSRASSCGSSPVSGETTSKRVSSLGPNSATLTMSPPPRRRCPIHRGRAEGVHRRARWTAQPGEHAMTSRARHDREPSGCCPSPRAQAGRIRRLPGRQGLGPRHPAPPWPPSATTPITSTGPTLPEGDARRVAGTPSPESRDWLKDDDEWAAQDASVERLPCLRGPRKEQPRCGPRPRSALKAQVCAATSSYVAVSCRRYPGARHRLPAGHHPAAGEPDRAQG